jgi:hypothetical protein
LAAFALDLAFGILLLTCAQMLVLVALELDLAFCIFLVCVKMLVFRAFALDLALHVLVTCVKVLVLLEFAPDRLFIHFLAP